MTTDFDAIFDAITEAIKEQLRNGRTHTALADPNRACQRRHR